MEEKVGMDTFEMNWREICEQEVSRKLIHNLLVHNP
jgi:hypothetical protein